MSWREEGEREEEGWERIIKRVKQGRELKKDGSKGEMLPLKPLPPTLSRKSLSGLVPPPPCLNSSNPYLPPCVARQRREESPAISCELDKEISIVLDPTQSE